MLQNLGLITYLLEILSLTIPFLVQAALDNEVNLKLNGTGTKTQSGTRRPHLNCILFGDTACQITCNVLCDLYGCHTKARCIDRVSCDCRETYTVSSETLTLDQYRNLTLSDLWYNNFKNSFSSRTTLQRIEEDTELAKNLTTLMQNPHVTGEYLKSELELLRSSWSFLQYIQPAQRGNTYRVFDDKYSFDYDRFQVYFNITVTTIMNQTRNKIQSMENTGALPYLLEYLKNDTNERYIISQVLWLPNNTLVNLINEYSRQNKTDILHLANLNATIVERENAAYDNFKNYLCQATENLVDQVHGKLREMKQQHNLPRLMNYINDRDDVKNIVSLLLMFPNDSIYSLMRNLVMQNRNDLPTISKRSHRRHEFVNPHDIDELISASVMERLLRLKVNAGKIPITTTTTIATTTSQITTTPSTAPTSTTASLRSHLHNLFEEIFGFKKPDSQVAENQQKPLPDLEIVLNHLVQSLLTSNNVKIEGRV